MGFRLSKIYTRTGDGGATLLLGALEGNSTAESIPIQRPRVKLEQSFGLPAQLALDLLGRRPDVIAARLQAQAQASRIEQKSAEFYPNINLSAFVGVQSLGLDLLGKNGSAIGSVGPAISLPLLNGGRLRGELRASEARYEEAVARYQGTLARALQEVADSAPSQQALAAQLAKRKADTSFGEELSNTISLRFITNRPRMELLAGAALAHPPLSAKVREISAQVFQISRDAIKLAMQGEPATATVRLLSAGRATLNSKLIETAGLLLKRYASKIANGPELESEFKSLTLNFGENSNGRAGSDQPREAGGLKLRIGNSEDV